MEVKVVISTETAIAEGHAQSGTFMLSITDEFVAELNESEREELICLVKNSTDASLWNQAGIAIQCESIERPNLPALKSLIERRIVARNAANARLEADAMRKASEKEETAIKAVQAWLAKDPESKLLGRAPNVSVNGVAVWPYEGIPLVVRDAYEMNLAHLHGIANQRNAEAAREEAEREATERRECAEQLANIKAWIAKHGSASMQAREAEKLLPEKELLHAVREWLFAPLADFPRYERLDEGDARHADSCYTGAPLMYQAEDADELTEAEYERLKALREAAKRLAEPAEVQAREHRVCCKMGECPEWTMRRSALVKVDWNGHRLSREYALTALGEDSYID